MEIFVFVNIASFQSSINKNKNALNINLEQGKYWLRNFVLNTEGYSTANLLVQDGDWIMEIYLYYEDELFQIFTIYFKVTNPLLALFGGHV